MTTLRSILTVAAAPIAAALAGCSAASAPNSSAVPPGIPTAPGQTMARHGWISPEAKKEKLLYVSDWSASIVLIYALKNPAGGPIGEITDGVNEPQGLALDASGTLYVADWGNNTVTEYPAGSITPSVTLSSGFSKPLDLSVDSNDTLYVTESTAQELLEFKKGSTSPDITITSLGHVSSVLNAKNNDAYVSYNQSSVGSVAVCKPLSQSCKLLGMSVGLAQGLAVDLKGNLLLGDVYGEIIDIYAPGQTSPFRTIPVSEEEPGKLAFDTTDQLLYMADPANGAIRIFNYASGVQQYSFTYGVDELEGIALQPGQRAPK